MSAISVHAPAKLNLFLAVTGRRTDGFHDLVSVVAPLDFGDKLHVETERGAGSKGREFTLHCDDPEVPCDETNLVLRAASAFGRATADCSVPIRGARFSLEKRIPMGGGLGGGSSDAVAALVALNRLAGEPLSRVALAGVAAQVGSDCPLFLEERPVMVRGRGERVERLPEEAAARLRGRRVLVFKPDFGIATPWAYARLAAGAPASYLPAAEAEARVAAWLANPDAPAEELLFNNMEPAAFAKFLALPVLLDKLRAEFGLAPRMSGSGSACFAFVPADSPVTCISKAIRSAWGESSLVLEARLM